MDWITLILGLAGGGSVVGLIVGIFTIPSAVKKASAEARKEEAEAKNAELNNMEAVANGWKELADERQEANKEKDARIAELTDTVNARYKDISDWRDKYNGLQEINTTLRVKLVTNEVKLCLVRNCEKREPQSGF